MAKTRTVEQELRESRSEVKELKEMLERKCEGAGKLETQVNGANRLKGALYAGFVQERIECIARLQRLEMRIRALGFLVPDIPGDLPADVWEVHGHGDNDDAGNRMGAG
jgi:hypothetical protein